MLDGKLKLNQKPFNSVNTFPDFQHSLSHAEWFSGKPVATALPWQAEDTAPALSSVGPCGRSFDSVLSRNESDSQSRTVV